MNWHLFARRAWCFCLGKDIELLSYVSSCNDEATCIFQAMQWINDMQFDNVVFVVNSKTTIDAFHSRQIDFMEFGHINYITACRDLFSTQFTNSQVECRRRQANMLAHSLSSETTLLATIIIHFVIPHVLIYFLLIICYKLLSLKKNNTKN